MKGNNALLIMAETGTAHGGSFETAQKLIDAAVIAGADCVKFQIVYADEILHPDTGFVQLPVGKIRLYDRFKELETKPEFYERCRDYAQKCGILFCASPFGIRSLHELWNLKPFAVKIASPELNHFSLLQELAALEKSGAQTGKTIPVILSSGVSKAGDIECALEFLSEVPDKALLHCVTSYPAPEEEYNLRILEPLATLFGLPCGISDHSLHPSLVPVLAAANGAQIIEKHICLDKQDGGLDDPIALQPDEFAVMVKSVRLAQQMPKADIIAMASQEFGVSRVEAVLGTGKKILSPSETANYTRTNRSIHFTRTMKAGDIVHEADIAILRTEKVLSPGISPKFLTTIRGAVLMQDAQNGEGLRWEHLIKYTGCC